MAGARDFRYTAVIDGDTRPARFVGAPAGDVVPHGHHQRRPDPAAGRAKLIDLTKRGNRLMADAGDRVADIERRWSKVVGAKDFAHMCSTMQRLLDDLDPEQSQS